MKKAVLTQPFFSVAIRDQKMKLKVRTPESLADLRQAITENYQFMSGRLQLVSDFFLQNPNQVALETVVSIASEIGVSPSTLVRFANFLGFKGFSQLQQLFVGELKGRVNGYRERVRLASDQNVPGNNYLLDAFFGAQTVAIENLASSVGSKDLKTAIDLMDQAQTIYVTGARRAFPVAYYLSYALLQADIDVVLLENAGALHKTQLKRLGRNDLLLAISFYPHADETSECIRLASENNVKTLILTDPSVHPCHRLINHSLRYNEAEVMGMRSLSCSMHLAQSLVMGLIIRKEESVSYSGE